MAKAFVQRDTAVTGKYYVETEGGGDTPAGGISYSTEEQDTGLKWIDDKSIYQVTVDLENPVIVPQNTETSIFSVDAYNIDTLVNAIVKPGKNAIAGEMCYVDNGYFKVNMHQAWAIKTVTMFYTKTE